MRLPRHDLKYCRSDSTHSSRDRFCNVDLMLNFKDWLFHGWPLGRRMFVWRMFARRMLVVCYVVFLVVFLDALGGPSDALAEETLRPQRKAPNILLITVDNFGVRRLAGLQHGIPHSHASVVSARKRRRAINEFLHGVSDVHGFPRVSVDGADAAKASVDSPTPRSRGQLRSGLEAFGKAAASIFERGADALCHGLLWKVEHWFRPRLTPHGAGL